MIQHYPDLSKKIDEMSDGDLEFKRQLTQAIQSGLVELQEKYEEGRSKQDENIIQQIRHKVKPTLMLFGFEDLLDLLSEGKFILEQHGFGSVFDLHETKIKSQVKLALADLGTLSQ
ncbi:hypothetical protein [Algoriphagus namhaensis]